MNRKLFYFITAIVLTVVLYFTWACTGKLTGSGAGYQGKVDIEEFGVDSGRGNIVSIQPYMLPGDYVSEQSFCNTLDNYLKKAQKKGWLKKNTIVSFPEYLGTWLVVAGEKKGVFEAKTVNAAMQTMVLSNLFSFIPEYFRAKANDKSAAALFRMKSKQMASIYNEAFSSLARLYSVTIVAGSIVLPEPEIKDGVLSVHDGNLYNVSVVYRPDGKAEDKLIKKAFPVAHELAFTCKAEAEDIPVYNTPAGKMAVLICADSWYAPCYKNASAQNVDFVIVPSYVEGNGAFKTPWPGYSGFDNPVDVDKSDIGKITILDGWVRYALPGRMKRAGLKNGIITFLHGQFWDLGSDMHLVMVKQGEAIVKQPDADASVVSLWL